MNFLNNKHIINSVRNTLLDKDDSIFQIEEKVDVINNAINMYSKYIFNYKKYELSVSIDWLTYITPENTNFVKSVKWKDYVLNWYTNLELREDYDYFIDEFNNIIFYSNVNNITSLTTTDIEVILDTISFPLEVKEVWTITSWVDIEITVWNIENYIIWDVVMLKDATKEEICLIKDISNWKIKLDITNDFTGAYLISNSLVKDFDTISIYSNYYKSSKNSAWSGQIKSESWTQGWRSQSVSYATYSWKGETWNENLDLIINKLKSDKNYRFKDFDWIKVFNNYK